MKIEELAKQMRHKVCMKRSHLEYIAIRLCCEGRTVSILDCFSFSCYPNKDILKFKGKAVLEMYIPEIK